jgi:sulfatase maturation enzyme AslB (radical SAM superfamily)
MLLESEQADFLARHRFFTQVSFDGVPSAQRLRGEQTFPVLDALLDRLRAQYPEFYDRDLQVSLTLTPETISSLADSIDYFVRTKHLRNIAISPVTTPATDWRPERIDELDRAIESIFDISLQHFERTGEVPVQMFRRSGRPPATHAERVPMCRIGGDELDEIAVDVDGQAHGCLMFAGSYQVLPTVFLRSRVEAMRLGDVRDLNFDRRVTGFPEAARSTALFHDKQLKYSSYRRCADCEHLAECIVCPMSIGRHEGEDDPHRVPDFNCAFSLVSLKYRARFPRALTFAEMLAGPPRGLFLGR